MLAAATLTGCGKMKEADAKKSAQPAFNLGMCSSQLDVHAGSNATLPPGGCLTSPSRRVAAVMMNTGEFKVASVTSATELGTTLWSSKAQTGAPSTVITAFQEDGNLVTYDAGGKAIWASGSGGPAEAYRLELTDKGELQIHRISNGKLSWSNVSGPHVDALKTDTPLPEPHAGANGTAGKNG